MTISQNLRQPHVIQFLIVHSILTYLLFYSCNLNAQSKVFSPAELREDFDVFRGSIEEMHPGLYWYTSKEEMDQSFNRVSQNLEKELSEMEFFRMLAPIISKIRCSHTWIAPSKELSFKTREERPLFPLEIKLINQKVYCSINWSDNDEIKPGNEILKINGLTVDSLVSLVQVSYTGDGFIKTWKNYLFENYFRNFFAYFVNQPNSFEVEFVDLDGNVKISTIEALTIEVLRNRKKAILKPRRNINLEFLDKKIALLDIRDFNPWKEGKKKKSFKKVLDQSFESIDSSKVDNLIIDLRGNTGGYEKYGLRLLSYFKDDTFIGYKHIKFKATSFKYRKYSKTGSVLFMIFKALMNHEKVNDTTYLLKNDRNIKPVAPLTPTFNGNAYILIDGGSISTTSDFASLFQYHDLGVFVGEETGGSSIGNSGNFSFNLTLPNTKIRYELPIAQYILNVDATAEMNGRGVIPDYPVDRNISDILNDEDTQLNFVLDLIKKSKEN